MFTGVITNTQQRRSTLLHEFEVLLVSPSKTGLTLMTVRSSAKEKQNCSAFFRSTYSDHQVAMASTPGLRLDTQNGFFLQTVMGS